MRIRFARACTAVLVALCVVVLGVSYAEAATVQSVALRMATLDGASTSKASLAKYEGAVKQLQKFCKAPNVGAIGDDAVKAQKSLGRGGVARRVRLLTLLQDVKSSIHDSLSYNPNLSCATAFSGYVALNS